MDLSEPKVIACWPTDRALIDLLNKRLPVENAFRPSVQHSPTTCEFCGRGVWIGPKQKELHQSPFTRTAVACTVCVLDSMETGEADYEVIHLNPEIDNVEKRY